MTCTNCGHPRSEGRRTCHCIPKWVWRDPEVVVAGQGVEQARRVRLEHVRLPERRAALHVDTVRAFIQRGKLREAYTELTAAENLAPEELKERPVVHNLIEELRVRSTRHLRRGLTQLADRVGAAR